MPSKLVAAFAIVLAGCAASPSATRTTSSAAAMSEWRSLIDPSISFWRGYRSQTVPAGWSVVNGVLTKTGESHDIVSREQFGDFELQWDWRLTKGGNAGVFYRGTEEYDYIFWSAPEYQLLDDENHPDGKNRLTAAGSNFGLYATPAGVAKPAGEWNSSRLVARGKHVEHWLNGQKVVEYDIGSPDWSTRVAASKFGKWPHYGTSARGYLSIQGDHDGTLEIRDMKIREIK